MKKVQLLVLGLTALLMVGSAVAQEIVINEIYYDSIRDEGCFTELKGTPDMSLDGFSLVGVNGNGGAIYATIDLAGYSVPADGYFVVCMDATVPEADMIAPLADWQNGADQVQLVFTGQVTEIIDSICYGGTVDLVCEGDPGPDVSAGSSTSRCPDGSDTNDNAFDCYADDTPTPGVMNDADCAPPVPTEYSLCEIMEIDVDGFPVHFGEFVHITSPVRTLNENLIYSAGRLEVGVTDLECCSLLFDYNYTAPYPAGTVFDVTGTVDFYNGKIELASLTLIEQGNDVLPDPYEITTGEVAMYGETYESCLIWICGLAITEGAWPVDGVDANLVVDDGSGPTTLRIDKDTDIDGSAAPVEPFTAVGILGQYDSTGPYFDGYQFLPRNLGDIYSGLDCPQPTPTRQTTWGQIKTTYK
ncbi:MAG: hypothetical protein KJ970_09095 [Candidatus Eisenbacteria bacterium]|uniref:Lamin tail domain-containing protein n=1 Tax=Eiseniibacteriota bacterium TaxID=2212470 RepID=A0A948WCN0_UNCEI|nr:hypothetical protein [Candidatus Eisenbacteria bacterium]MBU1948537.1 hypothetical protein [Candidatus Eisenbacteria bacterium]MBU2691073.1 hypothetical protein [Candidatus Eisenbacteria bacterium]